MLNIVKQKLPEFTFNTLSVTPVNSVQSSILGKCSLSE